MAAAEESPEVLVLSWPHPLLILLQELHQASVIRSFGAAAQAAWMPDTEGKEVLGKDLLGVNLQAGAVFLQRRGSEACSLHWGMEI